MEISAVNNVPDIIKRVKVDIVPENIRKIDSKQVRQKSQDLPENEKNIPVNEEQIKNIIEQANKSLAACSTRLEFTIHEKTKEIIVKVLNTDTGEVIKEIPSEKSLDRFAEVLENNGLLVDEKV